jgi:hypothetical protein
MNGQVHVPGTCIPQKAFPVPNGLRSFVAVLKTPPPGFSAHSSHLAELILHPFFLFVTYSKVHLCKHGVKVDNKNAFRGRNAPAIYSSF